MTTIKRQKQLKFLLFFKKTHKILAIIFFVFFLFISLTGMLLGLKKHSSEWLLPKTYVGTSTDFKNWLAMDSLHNIACQILQDYISKDVSLELNKIDIRKNSGVVKFDFEYKYWGIQLDGATGKLLHIGVRRSDFIENLHDGSILDRYLGTSNGQIKVLYTSIMGLSLLLLTITGFWMWYGPKLLRKSKSKDIKSLNL